MGIDEDIKEIKEILKPTLVEETKKEKKKKKFKMPFGKKVSKTQAKKNWITVMKINENGHVNFSKTKIDEQTIMEDGVPRLATNQFVMFYENNPLIILPNWSVEPLPFNPRQNFIDSLENGTNTKAYKILMAKMLKETVNPKKPMAGWIKWVVGIGIAGLIGYALISGGGKAK